MTGGGGLCRIHLDSLDAGFDGKRPMQRIFESSVPRVLAIAAVFTLEDLQLVCSELHRRV